MNNTECIIFTTKGGSKQTIRKTKSGWIMKSGKGKLYKMTAEQVLSHLLPVLAGKKGVTIKVKRKA